MTVLQIADLSTLWADVEIYEHQIQYLRPGQTVQISADAFPGRHWSGKVVFLDPSLNQQTRTLRASVEIGNRDGKLRPEMFVNVEITRPASTGIVKVPEEVVLRTGTRSVVIVQKEPGVFEPREVHLGAAGGGFREIRRGLEAGETVVASSQFLIDSESSLREAIGTMLGHQH
jgi:Cu(I)/Ag(I) efflux system membrane fusion protein